MEVFNLLSDVKIRFATLTARAIKFLILSSSLCSSELVFAQMELCRAAVLLGSENFHSLMRNVPLHHIYRLFSACKFLTFINQIIAAPLPTPRQPCGGGVLGCPGWIGCCAHSIFTHGSFKELASVSATIYLWRYPTGSHSYVKYGSFIVSYNSNDLTSSKM